MKSGFVSRLHMLGLLGIVAALVLTACGSAASPPGRVAHPVQEVNSRRARISSSVFR